MYAAAVLVVSGRRKQPDEVDAEFLRALVELGFDGIA